MMDMPRNRNCSWKKKIWSTKKNIFGQKTFVYSKTLNKEYIERIHQMSYSSLSDNGML